MIAIEFLLFACAIYMFFLTVKMNNTREIPSFFINNRIKLEDAKDKEGYINYMTPRLYLFEALMFVFSLISILAEIIFVPAWLVLISNIAYIVVLFVYAVLSVKAQNKYLSKY